jgi:hypothetical protein
VQIRRQSAGGETDSTSGWPEPTRPQSRLGFGSLRRGALTAVPLVGYSAQTGRRCRTS